MAVAPNHHHDDEHRRPIPVAVVGRTAWQHGYLRIAAVSDAIAASLGLLASSWLSMIENGSTGVSNRQVPFALLAVAVWVVVLGITGSYDSRIIGGGTDEYRRVLNGGLVMFGVVSTVAYLLKLGLARSFVIWAVPLALLFTIIGRFLLRKRLHHRRRSGKDVKRTLLVGRRDELTQLASYLERESWAGYFIVGMCTNDRRDVLRLSDDRTIRTYGSPAIISDAIHSLSVDTLVITSIEDLGAGGLRELTWNLEDSQVQLVVAPAVTDIAGPRITSRPVAGLPLLHVEAPRLSTAGRVFKAVFDRAVALVAIVVLSPVMLAAAVAVKASSRGPVLYRQERVGLGGRSFTLMKFRTMAEGSEHAVTELSSMNQGAGPLFKLRDDPRVTPLGRVLRRLSIDELPQLFQVLTGEMSIVGPRPPLPNEVATYEDHVHRKFLVKPGMTGLWQVSGRSELPWEEAVRLDLYYVDNWSPTMDVVICLKTVKAVVGARGAY